MDNVTHSLVGATLAELALPSDASPAQRRAFFVAGILAANLPDADLFYSRIAPPPLGYLLHHRGHTHTVGGLVAQAALLGAICLLPVVRRQVGSLGRRLAVLIVVGLISHLVLDSWNSYGVHPFWPLDARWVYGDAIFIVEPWLWLLLGASAALNTRERWGRLALGVLLVGPVVAATVSHVVPVRTLVALVVAAVVLITAAMRLQPRLRAGAALALSMLFVASMLGVSRRVRSDVVATTHAAAQGAVVDVVLNPQPANPLCWTALAIAVDEPRGEYVTTRYSATPVGLSGCGSVRTTSLVPESSQRHSLSELRELYRRDCSVRAWMRFGRVPVVADQTISDARFGSLRGNFTSMTLRGGAEAARCVPLLPAWGTPRADLVGSPM